MPDARPPPRIALKRRPRPADALLIALAYVGAIATLAFMTLHALKADARKPWPWLAVVSPVVAFATLILTLILAVPFLLRPVDRPPLTARICACLSALTALAVSVKAAVPAAGFSWAVAFTPLLLLLALRLALHLRAATTRPRRRSHGHVGISSSGVGVGVGVGGGGGGVCGVGGGVGGVGVGGGDGAGGELLPMLTLCLGGISTLLLIGRLSSEDASLGWWGVAAPWLLALCLELAAACAGCASLATPTPLPPRVEDPADWLLQRETEVLSRSTRMLCSSLLQLFLITALCAQLSSTSPSGYTLTGSWAATYAPFAALILCPLCCLTACAASLSLAQISERNSTPRAAHYSGMLMQSVAVRSSPSASEDSSQNEAPNSSLLPSLHPRSEAIK